MSPQPVPSGDFPETIDGVLESLDHIVSDARQQGRRLGYFAALYRRVTARVKDGIAAGEFEDGERMQRLDVVFANRYLEALRRFQNGTSPTKCWQVAFRASTSWQLLILQHLLLGMNAHINLDLGIAAVAATSPEQLPELKNDFFAINRILSELLDDVQERLNRVSPGLKWLDKVGGRVDEAVMNFSIGIARDQAWAFAQQLAALNVEERQRHVEARDRDIEALAHRIRSPGPLLTLAAFVIRLFENGNVGEVLDVLS